MSWRAAWCVSRWESSEWGVLQSERAAKSFFKRTNFYEMKSKADEDRAGEQGVNENNDTVSKGLRKILNWLGGTGLFVHGYKQTVAFCS